MCRVEERIYIGAEGHRSKFEEAFPCDKARAGRLCAKVKKRTTEYYPKRATVPRDSTPSPVNPLTPTASGTYLVQQRRPSSASGRPSTREGHKAIKPEIVIEFGSKKDNGKKYNSVSVSTKAYKRSSLGDGSIGSNDAAIESPGSDASHTIRTGFPDTAVPSPSAHFGPGEGFNFAPTLPQSHHHRQTSSNSSITGSSRTPSLYVTSDPDYDSPTNQRTQKHHPTVVHNPPVVNPAPSSPSKAKTQHIVVPVPYRTTVVTPSGFAQATPEPDTLFPLDNSDLADRSASSHASSNTPEITRRGKDRDQRRKQKDESRKRQEYLDREDVEMLAAKEENIKQVRFELGRAEARAQERNENILAEKDKRRAEEREEARRRKDKEREEQATKERDDARRRKEKEREEQAAKERKREKTKPPTNDFNTKRPSHTRRLSMTQSQIDEQKRLLATEQILMQNEREAAEAREREERNVSLRQQQQKPNYYDPRGGDRNITGNAPAVGRRHSVSRRNSVSTKAPPTGFSVSTPKSRANVVQANPPSVNAQVAQNFAVRPPNARQHAPPPVSFPSSFTQDYSRPPSARRPSYSQQENPFAVPPTRGTSSGLENPFSPTSTLSPQSVTRDPWDVREMRDTLPSTRQVSEERYTMQRRGADAIHRAETQARAQHSTRSMGRAGNYDQEFETDSEDEVVHSYGRR